MFVVNDLMYGKCHRRYPLPPSILHTEITFKKKTGTDVALIHLDQGKSFDFVDHIYLESNLTQPVSVLSSAI